VRDSLRDMQHVITVEPEIADRARLAIERMVAIGAR
jgi:quinolinate synthase